MFEILFTIFHVLICVLLVVTVLLQAGKGGGLAGSIGGGLASSSVLGGRTAATFLTKATTVLATAFMLSCLVQSVAFQTAETTPTTATQRTMAEEQVPAVPAIPEAEHLLGEQEEAAETSTAEEPPAEAQ
ncbi:MAG: preprotein translocase subunit SecG [Gemmatimonadetes bacterium]|nr:preprotein translocase subunit SecG [Gemmatimonadota bacterium]